MYRVLILMLFAACVPTLTEPQDELSSAKAHWSALSLAHYRYDFQQVCHCVAEITEPVTIVVWDGRVAEVRSRRTGERLSLDVAVPWPTFSDLLAEAERARRAGVRVVVEYGARGLPIRIEIGEVARDAGHLYLLGEVVRI